MSDLPASDKEVVDGRSDFVVMKFGGTSVEDAAAIERVLAVVQAGLARHPVVVVSAMARVTDALLAIAQMPPGIPVATVGVDNARNAAALALRILRA